MHISDAVVLAIASALALFGGWVVILNFAAVVGGFRHRHVSFVYLAGGLSLTTAMLLSPIPSAARLAWVPLVLDPGCLYSLLGLLYSAVVLRAFRGHE